MKMGQQQKFQKCQTKFWVGWKMWVHRGTANNFFMDGLMNLQTLTDRAPWSFACAKWAACLFYWLAVVLLTVPYFIFEPQHDKTNKMTCAPSKDSDQIVGSIIAKDPRYLHADCEGSDQTGRMPRLIWVFAGCTCHFTGIVMLWLISVN